MNPVVTRRATNQTIAFVCANVLRSWPFGQGRIIHFLAWKLSRGPGGMFSLKSWCYLCLYRLGMCVFGMHKDYESLLAPPPCFLDSTHLSPWHSKSWIVIMHLYPLAPAGSMEQPMVVKTDASYSPHVCMDHHILHMDDIGWLTWFQWTHSFRSGDQTNIYFAPSQVVTGCTFLDRLNRPDAYSTASVPGHHVRGDCDAWLRRIYRPSVHFAARFLWITKLDSDYSLSAVPIF